MTVSEAIAARRSIRKYETRAIPRDVLSEIIEAGMRAPNANNKQAWYHIVIENAEGIARLEKGIKAYMTDNGSPSSVAAAAREDYHPLFAAPCVILLCGSLESRWSDVDCALAAENMGLLAVEKGLGSCIVGFPGTLYRNESYREYFGGFAVPEGYEVKFALTLGYPEESPAPRNRDFRKVVYYE